VCDESRKRAKPSPNKTRDRLGLSAIAASASEFSEFWNQMQRERIENEITNESKSMKLLL